MTVFSDMSCHGKLMAIAYEDEHPVAGSIRPSEFKSLEREKGFEPSTLCLGSSGKASHPSAWLRLKQLGCPSRPISPTGPRGLMAD